MIPADTLLEESKCYTCLGLSQIKAIILALWNRIIGAGPCGAPTSTIQADAGVGAPATGTYSKISPTLWEQTAPSPEFGFYLVGGIWRARELISPGGPDFWTIPEAQFPCGTWTAVGGSSSLSAHYA